MAGGRSPPAGAACPPRPVTHTWSKGLVFRAEHRVARALGLVASEVTVLLPGGRCISAGGPGGRRV